MSLRQLTAVLAIALLAPLGVAACTTEGQGTKTECAVSGCTVTFSRGVNAKASFLGVDAELVAVNGNTVVLRVAGQEISVPVGETKPADGVSATVQEITGDKVVVKFTTGITTN